MSSGLELRKPSTPPHAAEAHNGPARVARLSPMAPLGVDVLTGRAAVGRRSITISGTAVSDSGTAGMGRNAARDERRLDVTAGCL